MNIILIVIALLIVVVLYVKFNHAKTQLFYKALVVVVVLFFCSVGYVWFRSGVNLSSYEGFLSLGRTYFSWIGSFVGNIGSISGHITGYDWNAVANSTIIPTP